MKNKFSLFIVISLLLNSCYKENFKKTDITETNNYGDYVGNVDASDWTIEPYTTCPSLLKNNLALSAKVDSATLQYDTLQSEYKLYQGILNGKYNTGCPLPDFHMIAYPNPVNKRDRIFFHYAYLFDVEYVYYITTTKSGNPLFSSGSAIRPGNDTVIFEPRSIPVSQMNNQDFTLYYLFSTKNGCLFWGKGDVIVK